jgi:hypothetical protein
MKLLPGGGVGGLVARGCVCFIARPSSIICRIEVIFFRTSLYGIWAEKVTKSLYIYLILAGSYTPMSAVRNYSRWAD